MAKPDKVPTWASGGSAQRVEPPAEKKELGYRAAERPVHGYENWLAYYVGQWCDYLNTGTLDGSHTITGDLTVTGTLGNVTATSVAADVATLDTIDTQTLNVNSATGEVHHAALKIMPITLSDTTSIFGGSVGNGSSISAGIFLDGTWNCRKFQCAAWNSDAGMGTSTVTVKLYYRPASSAAPTLLETTSFTVSGATPILKDVTLVEDGLSGCHYITFEASGDPGYVGMQAMQIHFTR